MNKFLIDRFAAWLLGAKPWGEIQGIVSIVESPTKTGAQKREEALAMLKELGLGLAGFLLNLGLELAVTKLRGMSNV